jgi:hypothetical protein
MSLWREHHGGACPTDQNSLVRCRYASGWTSTHDQRAGGLVWTHRAEPFDIVAYQVVSVPQEARG